MRSALIGVCIVASLLNCRGALADNASANTVMVGCRNWVRGGDAASAQEAYDRGLCMGLITGVVFAHDDICPPPSATLAQGMGAVVQYIEAVPARHDEKFLILAGEALQKAWPCGVW